MTSLTNTLLISGGEALGKSWGHVLYAVEGKEDARYFWARNLKRFFLIKFSWHDIVVWIRNEDTRLLLLFGLLIWKLYSYLGFFFVPIDDYAKGKQNKEQREKLGLAPAPKARSAPRTPPSERTNALQKVEVQACDQRFVKSNYNKICLHEARFAYLSAVNLTRLRRKSKMMRFLI